MRAARDSASAVASTACTATEASAFTQGGVAFDSAAATAALSAAEDSAVLDVLHRFAIHIPKCAI